MSKQYQWKTSAEIISGGYPGEEYGVLGVVPDWTTTDVLSGSTSAVYYLTDSNSQDNNNSSQVFVDISESWTASIDSQNYLTISLTTIINRIYRDNIRGNPLIGGNATREFYLRREAGGALIWSIMNDNIDTAHTLLGTPLTLDQYTFTLAPGENLSRGSVYFRGNTNGHGSDPVPSFYVDEMWLGTYFRNILPKDYRPGATLNTNSNIWWSHNRANGACHVLSNVGNMTWTEMRTIDGGSGGQGNPPLISHAANSNSWYNQKLLGRQS